MGKKKYERAGEDVLEVIETVRRQSHEHLEHVRITVLVVYGPTKDGSLTAPALTLYKRPCLAMVKLVNDEDRVGGLGDVKLLIDGDSWAELKEDEREGLIDHELEHIHFEGELDQYDRPKVALKSHDVEITGLFIAVARRRGRASQEYKQVRALLAEHGEALGVVGPSIGEPLPAPQRRPRRRHEAGDRP